MKKQRRTRRTFTREFKMDAVQLAQNSGLPLRQIEADLGLSSALLGRWVQEFVERGEEAFTEPASHAENVRIRELERRVAVLEEERAILKKAVGIFSQAKP